MEFIYNKNTALYYKSAKELLLPVEIIHSIEGFLFRLGNKTYFFRGLETPFNNSCSTRIAENKSCTNKILASAGITVPKATSIHISQFHNDPLEILIEHLKFPLVLKPTVSSLGRNVYCNIPDMAKLKELMTTIFSISDWLTIEEFHGNLNSYRVLVFKKKIIGVVQRFPAHIIGDGLHTITELVDEANIQREQLGEEFAPIQIDEECHFRLQELGITPNYIPIKNERVVLCYTCNASRGGTYQELSTKICKKNKQLFIKIASILNLNIAGIDIECADINQPITASNGVIIEVNADPSVRIHENSYNAKINRVTKKMIRSIIYRHPLSFLYVLYKNKHSALYFRMLSILVVAGLMFKFIEIP